MIFFPFFILFSISTDPISQSGYYTIETKANSPIDVSLSHGKYDCVFIWSHTKDNDAEITVKAGEKSKSFELKGETTAIVKGDETSIKVNSDTTIHVWVIENNVCDMNSLLYTTPNYAKDTFKIKPDIKNLCIFFGSHNNQSKISLSSTSSEKSSSSKITVHSIDKQSQTFDSLKSKTFNSHFFTQIANPASEYDLEFEISGNEPGDAFCSVVPIHMVLVDKEYEEEVIESNSIQCNKEAKENNSFLPFMLAIVAIVAIIIIAGVLHLTGYFKKIRSYFRGEIINDGPAKVEIDPKELLRMDEIDGLDIEDEEEPKPEVEEKEN
ncbi:hypothetical protein TRFO_30499 [Tritrichomonas foetus]|uniref:Uncharacterized protein n=1 Tax=Tritrichomonas foetus TaxID=1144522 RepID=A0A1J4JTI7_9EUKA|nr:hypothetical protein TRFO_30499 [Tritrichomonas foetus]|eukprot:OHT02431.1 hypothetical protein TRFO_30499 [Tritrichomonas foetus]